MYFVSCFFYTCLDLAIASTKKMKYDTSFLRTTALMEVIRPNQGNNITDKIRRGELFEVIEYLLPHYDTFISKKLV